MAGSYSNFSYARNGFSNFSPTHLAVLTKRLCKLYFTVLITQCVAHNVQSSMLFLLFCIQRVDGLRRFCRDNIRRLENVRIRNFPPSRFNLKMSPADGAISFSVLFGKPIFFFLRAFRLRILTIVYDSLDVNYSGEHEKTGNST